MSSAIVGTPFRTHLVFDISGREVANYLTPRFTHEPELWRVHVRTIRAILISIDSTTKAGDKAVATLRWAGLFFLGGLLSVAAALAIFIVEVTF